MEYRLFFSYQSDTPKNVGQSFIQSVLDKVKAKLKADDIYLTIDYGFQGVFGNTVLIDEMLKKSKLSDIVLADITFTSSKAWNEAKKYKWLMNREIRVLEKTKDKKSPNPNVLLETGYAWALKGYERTVLILNTAYGEPEELPTDLLGFRHPITYTLDDKNIDKKSEIRAELVKTLFATIRKAINSEAAYQKELWRPLILHADWNFSDFQNKYVLTPKLKDFISKLRTGLDNPANPQRLLGPKNSGKSRLAYELYREIDGYYAKSIDIEKVLYYDMQMSELPVIEDKLLQLKSKNQRKILILDNCSDDVHRIVTTQILYETPVSILSIGNVDTDEIATLKIEEPDAKNVVEQIAEGLNNERNAAYITRIANGNLRDAIPLIQAFGGDSEELPSDYEGRWSRILDENILNIGALRFLEEVSVFAQVGISGNFESQSSFVIEQAGIESKEHFDNVINYLLKKGLIKRVGDFIVLEAFVEELATVQFEKLIKNNMSDYLIKVADNRLVRAFNTRLLELHKLNGTQDFIGNIISSDSLKSDYNFINSTQGSQFFMSLAELSPQAVMIVLTSVLGDKTTEELKDFKVGRRSIVWTLEKLVFREETFSDAAKLLFKLGVAETEQIGNNSESQFIQLFQIQLAGTEVDLSKRRDIINWIKEDVSAEKRPLLIQALNRALITGGFSRFGGQERQAGVEFKDYRPKSYDEAIAYWNDAISDLFELGAFDVIIKKAYTQIKDGDSDFVIEKLSEYLSEVGEIDEELRQQFEYILTQREGIPDNVISSIKKLKDDFAPKTLSDKLKYQVALAPYSSYTNEDGERVNKSEAGVSELLDELGSDDEWLESIDVLLKGKQSFTYFFGTELAKRKPNYDRLIDTVIEKLGAIDIKDRDLIILQGYFSELKDESFIRKMIDKFLEVESVSYIGVQLSRFLKVKSDDLNKVKPVLVKNELFLVLLTGIKIESLSWAKQQEFLNWLIGISFTGKWIAIDLIERIYEKEDIAEDKVEYISRLLMHDGMLRGIGAHSFFAISQYSNLVMQLSKNGLQTDLIQFLVSEIIKSTEDGGNGYDTHIRHVLELLLTEYWDESWSLLSDKIFDSDFWGWVTLKGLIAGFPFEDDKISKWLEQYPEEGPAFAAQLVRLYISDAGVANWTPIAMSMFNLYCDNQSFLQNVSSVLHSYSVSGSVVPHLIERLSLMEKLEGIKQIEDWVKVEIDSFKKQIEYEKKNEQNYGFL
jgi:hypothetical protein